ncbi:MAG TPA: oligogalacturonate lyase family protein [Verrucomicrobiae bacterium]|nr:oligogalacturonate lyase family protein [Verrucomicrobiae bacterium]
MRLKQTLLTFSLLVMSLYLSAADSPPSEWIDPDTGHRVVRLSAEPGSESLYFNENAWTAQGDKLVYYAPDGIHDYNFKTRQNELVVAGTNIFGVIVSRNSRKVYYLRHDGRELIAYSTHLDTHETRQIDKVPGGGSALAVNANDTLLAGSFIEDPAPFPRVPGERKGTMMARRLAAHQRMALFTLDIQSGALNVFNHSTDWLNHVQFSPTDPNLILFCHEGPWHLVDRIWTIHADGTGLKLIHPRTMQMEIAGHEFFSPDGKWIWYDLQTPRGEDFWLGGYEIATARRLWYHMQRDEWSIHFNVSHDGTLFAGDGGDPGQVAHAQNGRWLYLFHASSEKDMDTQDLIQAGVFEAEKLVNMAKQEYTLEPNVNFSPDDKWIVFRSNMLGPEYVFAVEVAKAQ